MGVVFIYCILSIAHPKPRAASCQLLTFVQYGDYMSQHTIKSHNRTWRMALSACRTVPEQLTFSAQKEELDFSVRAKLGQKQTGLAASV